MKIDRILNVGDWLYTSVDSEDYAIMDCIFHSYVSDALESQNGYDFCVKKKVRVKVEVEEID